MFNSPQVAAEIATLMHDETTLAVLALPGGAVDVKQLWLTHLRTAARFGNNEAIRRIIEIGERAGLRSEPALKIRDSSAGFSIVETLLAIAVASALAVGTWTYQGAAADA